VQFLNQEVPQAAAVHNFIVGKLEATGGSFVVLDKLDVNGKRTHPMYHFLKSKSPLYRPSRGKVLPIPWNYGKFLVDRQGQVMDFKGPKISPLELEPAIRQLLL